VINASGELCECAAKQIPSSMDGCFAKLLMRLLPQRAMAIDLCLKQVIEQVVPMVHDARDNVVGLYKASVGKVSQPDMACSRWCCSLRFACRGACKLTQSRGGATCSICRAALDCQIGSSANPSRAANGVIASLYAFR
jgi:hypothetical protein